MLKFRDPGEIFHDYELLSMYPHDRIKNKNILKNKGVEALADYPSSSWLLGL